MFNSSHFHPLTVHFPIALIILGFLTDLYYLFFRKEKSLSKTGLYLQILGTIGAIVAYLTGEIFTKEITGKANDIEETHELFANITMYVMIVASIIRLYMIYFKPQNNFLKWLVFVMITIGAVSVGITGLYGGTLVYNYLIPHIN